jgi:molybdopterin synthase sulfur carrier subunit
MSVPIRVELPSGLRLLARIEGEVNIAVAPPVTQRTIIDAIEQAYPELRGTIRDRETKIRRPFVRFFACQRDLSHHSMDDPLPEQVASGAEAFLVVGAIAGG